MHDDPPRLAPPAELRPAQLGIVLLSRVIFGHISATLVDLAERDFLHVEEAPENGKPDWLLTDLRKPAADRRELLAYETTLLTGLFAGQSTVRLSEISQALIPTLNLVRAQIRRDAVQHGWLRRWPRDQRTARGEQLLKQIQVFRTGLRALVVSGDLEALAGLAPYAVLFGLGAQSLAGLDVRTADKAPRCDAEVAWSQTDRFVQCWLLTCAGFSDHLDHGHGHRADAGPLANFVQQWSAPVTHGQAGHGPGSGHDGYGGGDEHIAGGHVGGGHSGH